MSDTTDIEHTFNMGYETAILDALLVVKRLGDHTVIEDAIEDLLIEVKQEKKEVTQ
jgi:hypothetical protein